MKWTIRVELTPDGNPPITYDIGTITRPIGTFWIQLRRLRLVAPPLTFHSQLLTSTDRNREAVKRLIESFAGLTPFVLDTLVAELSRRAGLGIEKVREAMSSMKQLGIFEDRPGFPGSWRTGRLYKAGLAMKYVRG